ncbi:MAG: hypothetical protein QXD24_08185, partial [Candidatus Caldarchaeum sp.]
MLGRRGLQSLQEHVERLFISLDEDCNGSVFFVSHVAGQLKLLPKVAEVLGREPPKPRINKDGRWIVGVGSKTLYELLRKPLKLKRLRPFIEYSDECMGAFLRGFFDSEGSIS